MKLPKGKVSIATEIKVYTRHPNGRKTQSKDGLEGRIEQFLQTCYKVYIKNLIENLPAAVKGTHELVEVDDYNMDFRRKRKEK